MSSTAVLVAIVALAAGLFGLAVGSAVGWRFGRHAAAEGQVEREQAVQAAVSAVLAERQATAASLGVEREHTVRAAVDTVVAVAGARFDDRLATGTREIELRTQSFDQRAKEINAELAGLRKLVAELQAERARQHGEVVTRLEQTARVAGELSATTQSLRETLASSRARGQWGERMAADVLRAAGFVEGINYRRQTAITGGRIPDFTFLLPKGLELNMDVKFPIDNYVRYLDAADDTTRELARRDFLRDVRNRVKEITGRDYIDPERTVDHVLLFIPNESVYSFIHEHDAQLLDLALGHRVVVCSPTTLFAVLAVVRQAVDNFQLERTSGEILEALTRFRTQWDKFSGQIEKVGRGLDAASRAFDDLNGPRRRMLERELDRIDNLQTSVGLDAPGDRDDDGRVRPLRAG
jgi:DNA recombination protein RmuC